MSDEKYETNWFEVTPSEGGLITSESGLNLIPVQLTKGEFVISLNTVRNLP